MLCFHKNCILCGSYDCSVKSSWHLLALGVKRCACGAAQALTYTSHSPVCARRPARLSFYPFFSPSYSQNENMLSVKCRNLNRNLWEGSAIATDFLVFKNNFLCTRKKKKTKNKDS